jgi:hypothetical protein
MHRSRPARAALLCLCRLLSAPQRCAAARPSCGAVNTATARALPPSEIGLENSLSTATNHSSNLIHVSRLASASAFIGSCLAPWRDVFIAQVAKKRFTGNTGPMVSQCQITQETVAHVAEARLRNRDSECALLERNRQVSSHPSCFFYLVVWQIEAGIVELPRLTSCSFHLSLKLFPYFV